MISAIVTAFVSFVSTNIDDIFVLMLFFSQIDDQIQKRHIIIGQYLGIMTLLFVSVLGSTGLNLIPQQYTGLLGIIPILLGVKEWLKYKKEKKSAVNSASKSVHPAVLNVSLVTIANGADNIGVYIPLFTRLNTFELIITIVIFILLIVVWCFIGERLTNFPRIKHVIQKYKNIVVPVVFIVIGLFILVESDLFSSFVPNLLK